MRARSLCLALSLTLVADAAIAADLTPRLAYVPPPVSHGIGSEIRGGVLAHGPATREEGSVDINGEILFSKPFVPADSLLAFLVPRIHVGGSVNTAGDTSQFYAGFTWTYDITNKVFVEASFGGAIHDGETGRFVPRDRQSLGCSPLFRESASIGYRLSENWSVMATVDHVSNAKLCNSNQGLTNYGVRIGYVF